MSDFTFLTKEQIFVNQLDILEKYGRKCAITDFSILLGGFVSPNNYAGEGNNLKDRTGWWWTKTPFNNDVYVVSSGGNGGWSNYDDVDGGARPALPYSSIVSFSSNSTIGKSGIKEITYGEYPQTIVDESYSCELEKAYTTGNIETTGKIYTTDYVVDENDKSFEPREHVEYKFNGKKYIRFVGDSNCIREKLSDDRTVEIGNPYWVAVEPITWLVDEKADIALSKKIIFSGVQFKNTRDYDGDFDKTDIKKFMDDYFSKDIQIDDKVINLNDIDLSLLSEEQLFGPSRLEVIKKYGTQATVTDLSILLGCCFASNYTGGYWTKTHYTNTSVRSVISTGNRDSFNVVFRSPGVRPALPYSLISSISSNVLEDKSGIKTVICGEYPQMAADMFMQDILHEQYEKKKLNKTGKKYTFDSIKYDKYNTAFEPAIYEEYIYDGNKYIRVKVNSSYERESIKLQSGVSCEDGDYVWIKVLPVEWIVDEKSNLAFAKNILVAGIRYDDKEKYNGDFEKTEMKKYLDTYMKHDLFQNVEHVYSTNDVEENITRSKRQNPYGFDFGKVSEEDIIRGAIQSNVSVFLHGRSSEGKSARVKQLDPNCEIIYMRNATPDSLNGKSVYNASTGEMIDVPPTWYIKIKEKCEKEPNKIHLIFFDELTNALPSIQGMAFNIILDGEINGKWKLPVNARIVAAGNDLNDSLAANQMAEPLFNRFAHVYINTTVNSWLKWASTPISSYERLDYKEEEKVEAKIHPSIFAYVAYKSYAKKDVLRTKYTGDKPNADPRKWEMASKVLYRTNAPEMLRALIGEELTKDFVEFTKQEVITVEDVINHNYTSEDLEMNVSQKFATAVGLLSVDEEHFEVVREFMKEVGPEPRAAFESMWAHGDERRLEKLLEVQLLDNQKGEVKQIVK